MRLRNSKQKFNKLKRFLMAILKLKDIKANMKVIDDVVNFKGAVLIKAGSTVTDKHLKALELWGITEANIEDNCQNTIKSVGKTNDGI